MTKAAVIAVNLVLLVVAPLPFLGIVARVKAWWSGRRGAPVLQGVWDVWKELRKGQVASRTVSTLFFVAPSLSLAATLAAALLVPAFNHRAIISFPGDFVLFAYLLGLGRFLALVAAMDTGSSFEGMGASREAFFAVIVEPGYFVILGALAYATGTTSFEAVFRGFHADTPERFLSIALASTGFFIMLLVEGKRVPVDDPTTHLELTMVHEAMILDNSGPDLAFIQYGSAVNVYLFASLVAGVILPEGLQEGVFLVLFLSLLLFQAAAVGLIESWIARLRLTHVPQLLLLVGLCGIVLFFIALLVIRR